MTFLWIIHLIVTVFVTLYIIFDLIETGSFLDKGENGVYRYTALSILIAVCGVCAFYIN